MFSRASTILVVSIMLIVIGVAQQVNADTSELPRIRPIPLIRVGGAFLESSTDLVVYVWYIEGANSRIIVDAGMDEAAGIAMGGWVVSSLDDGLTRVGLTPEDVDIVIFTHLHPDHVGHAKRFTNARLIVQSAELESALVEEHPSFDLVKDLDFETISGDQQIDDNVQVLLTPGHTPGGQSVLVETAAGKVVITGSCCTMEHFEPAITPPPRTADPDQLTESMQRVAEIADILVPLHDYSFADIDTIPTEQEANKALIQRMADALTGEKTPELIGEFFADEEMMQHVAVFEAAFPGYVIPFEDILAERDKVVYRGTFRATHKGEFMGIAPTGKDVTMPVIVTYRIANDKIVESWISADQLGLMQQLGAVTPGRPAIENYMWDEPSDVTGAPGAPEENKAIVHRVIQEFWNQKNVEVLDETHSPDSLAHNPAISASYPYPQTFHVYKEACLAYLTGLPDLQVAIDDTIAEEDKVALRWTATGTHKDELMGIPATDAQVEFSGTTLYRFADGKIVDTWWAWDALGMMRQLTAPPEPEKDYSNVFFMPLEPGLNMISPPLEPVVPYTARSFAEEIGATVVIRYDTALAKFVGFTLSASDGGFPIEGGEGYIVNVLESKVIPFTGAAWTNEPPVEAAPPAQTSDAWAFVISGSVDGMSAADDSHTAIVRNLRTGHTFTESVDSSGYFAVAWADLSRKAVIGAGDQVEATVVDSSGEIVSGPFIHDIRLDEIRNAVANLHLTLGEIIPEKTELLQNYPNPFNPDTWIPYQLGEELDVTIRIYSVAGQLVRTLHLGHKPAGFYTTKDRAAYWDGRNEAGEEVTSEIYFYTIHAGGFTAIKKMIIAR